MAEQWLAIVNPVAGRGAGAKLAGTLASTFADVGLRVDIARSPGPGECARLAAAAVEDGYKVIVAVGGDGTANEVANGMAGSPAALALYPIGTGNDFARNLGYPRGRKRLASFLAKATPHEIDVGIANGRAFVNHASLGIGAVVAERARGFGHYLGPMLGYAASSLAAIASFRAVNMRITIDGERREGRHLIVVASNGVRFGGGMKGAPEAEFDDGWLDVSLGGDLGPAAAVAALARLYRGTHVDGVRVQSARGREIDIELDGHLPMEMDGEVSRVRALSIRVNAKALRVLS